MCQLKCNTRKESKEVSEVSLDLDHDDVINDQWKHFLRYCPFVVRIHRSPMDSPHNSQYLTSIGSALVQVMACRLFGAKPSLEPLLAFCQLDYWEQILVKFESEFCHFHSRKCIWNCRLPKWRPSCPGRDELTDCGLVTPCVDMFRAPIHYLNPFSRTINEVLWY